MKDDRYVWNFTLEWTTLSNQVRLLANAAEFLYKTYPFTSKVLVWFISQSVSIGVHVGGDVLATEVVPIY